MTKACDTCAFWQPGDNRFHGDCRRHAPVTTNAVAETMASFWCGDYAPTSDVPATEERFINMLGAIDQTLEPETYRPNSIRSHAWRLSKIQLLKEKADGKDRT